MSPGRTFMASPMIPYWAASKIGASLSLFIATIYLEEDIPANREMDEWVKNYFAGKEDLREIIDALKDCSEQEALCADVFAGIAQRSPTALVLTLKLLRHNEGMPLAEVFNVELQAAEFIARHPDYTEGVRARLIDKDDAPRWQPDKIEQVSLAGLKL